MNDDPPLVFIPPRRHSGVQVLAELYRRVRNLKIDITLNYPLKNKWGKRIRVSGVVSRGERIVCFVWVRVSYNGARNVTLKRSRLDQFGLPVVVVRGMMRVPAAIDEIKRHYAAAAEAEDASTVAEAEAPFADSVT